MVVTAAGEVVSAGWDDKLRFADLGGKAYLSEVVQYCVRYTLLFFEQSLLSYYRCMHMYSTVTSTYIFYLVLII